MGCGSSSCAWNLPEANPDNFMLHALVKISCEYMIWCVNGAYLQLSPDIRVGLVGGIPNGSQNPSRG